MLDALAGLLTPLPNKSAPCPCAQPDAPRWLYTLQSLYQQYVVLGTAQWSWVRRGGESGEVFNDLVFALGVNALAGLLTPLPNKHSYVRCTLRCDGLAKAYYS